MKRNFIIALVAFAAVTAAVGTAVASLRPESAVATDIYVRKVADDPTSQRYSAGSHTVSGTGAQVVINVTDNFSSQPTRLGYASNLTTAILNSGVAISPSPAVIIN